MLKPDFRENLENITEVCFDNFLSPSFKDLVFGSVLDALFDTTVYIYKGL